MHEQSTFLNPDANQVRCPECNRLFTEWNARTRAALHYVEAHPARLKSAAHKGIAADVLTMVGKIELRMTQRKLLEYAAPRTFFILLQAEDSISAHSLERMGLLARCSPDGTKMRERFWVITTLGRLVFEAYQRRERELGKRKRQARKRLPDSHRT